MCNKALMWCAIFWPTFFGEITQGRIVVFTNFSPLWFFGFWFFDFWFFGFWFFDVGEIHRVVEIYTLVLPSVCFAKYICRKTISCRGDYTGEIFDHFLTLVLPLWTEIIFYTILLFCILWFCHFVVLHFWHFDDLGLGAQEACQGDGGIS